MSYLIDHLKHIAILNVSVIYVLKFREMTNDSFGQQKNFDGKVIKITCWQS